MFSAGAHPFHPETPRRCAARPVFLRLMARLASQAINRILFPATYSRNAEGF